MRKGLQAPLRYQSASRPSRPPAPPRSQCSDDSPDDASTTSSVGDLGLQAQAQPQQASPPPERPRARKEGSVQVAVRVRPLLPREIAANQRACVQHPTADSIELLDADKQFTFDHVFPQAATQSELYDKALQPWLDSFLQGFNVTVIAYGQTGSGKTYTMGNSMPSSEMVASQLFARALTAQPADPLPEAAVDQLKPDDGLIPRFLFQLFDLLNKAGKDEHQVSVSFLEIYGEEIHDLLQQPRQSNDDALESLQLREGSGGVYVQGLTEVKVSSRVGAMEQMRVGSLRRITGRTEMNEHSSRSHAVYTIKVVRRVSQEEKDSPQQTKTSKGILQSSQQKIRRSSTNPGSDSGGSSPRGSSSSATVVSKLTFVDLAGSERLKKTLAEGSRMKEGIQINVGLLALGNVINALGDDRRRGAAHLHVPYRSSKLTRLLQDALGGNSRTLFIACVSPAGSNTNETYNTLQYANRAKNIQNKAVKNIDSRSAELLQLKAFNNLLRRELVTAFFVQPEEVGSDSANAKVDSMMADPKVQRLLKKLEEIASSNVGQEHGSNNGASMEIQRVLSSMAGQFPGVSRSARVDVPETPDDFVDEGEEISGGMTFSNGVGDSFGDTSEESDDESAVKIAPFSLHQLSRTLDIITVTLEMRELQKSEISQRQDFGSRLFALERTRHRRNLIRTGLTTALEKLNAATPDGERSKEVQRSMRLYAEKLDSIDEEVKKLEHQKECLEAMLEERVLKCLEAVQSKRDRLRNLRQMTAGISGTTLVSSLDVIVRSTEIPERFGIKFLSEAADFLVGEEKAMASYLDESLGDIGFLSSIFTRDEMTSSEAFNVAEAINVRIQASLDNEALNADLSHEIRRRSALLQNIVQGWIASPDENLTEQEYIAANEQRLKECDESIADLSAALKARPASLQSISVIVDSISSLPLAKGTMKRLIESMYSHMRVSLAVAREPDSVDVVEEPSVCLQRQPRPDSFTTKRIEELKEEHDREIADMLNLLIATGATDGELSRTQANQLTKKCAQANEKIKELEETGEHLADQLKKRDGELSQMKERISELEKALKASEAKKESIRIMDRCQEIWTELGMSDEDQAVKFQDINELLLQKCSEELESLEAARAAIQERIDSTYNMVKLLEVAIGVDDPTELQMLRSVAGTTLLDQEKRLLHLHARRVDEFWLRVDARFSGLTQILGLLNDMKIQVVADFRHVVHTQLDHLSVDQVQSHFVTLQQFKEAKAQGKLGEALLKQLLEGLATSNVTVLAQTCLHQDDVLLRSLLNEKAKRVSETEQLLSSIRSISGEMDLNQENITSVLHVFIGAREHDPGVVNEPTEERVQAVASLIEQSGGRTDVSSSGIRLLTEARDGFVEIYDGRANAVTFLHSTLQEAEALTKGVIIDPQMQQGQSLAETNPSTNAEERSNSESESAKEYTCNRESLVSGKTQLDQLIRPIERAINALVYSTNDEFMKYGIDTADQRISFLLGRQDGEETSAAREVLAKYMSFTSGQDTEDNKLHSTPTAVESASRTDSLLSELDPLYSEFSSVYSVSYGKHTLQFVKDLVTHLTILGQTVKSAQKRLQSLSTIMKLYTEISHYREKISEFEASASSKDRLFGNSLRLLEEERFRKAAAKRYPQRIAALKAEVQKWLQNDGGDYDLNILGHDMKNMLLDMMNTDTELMHLDLGVVGSSRQSTRRTSKTLPMTPTLSSTSLSSLSSNNSSASASTSIAPGSSSNQHQQGHAGARPARARSLSTLAPGTVKKRS